MKGQRFTLPDVHVHQDSVPGEVELIHFPAELAVQSGQLQPVGLEALVGLQDQQGIGVRGGDGAGSAPSTRDAERALTSAIRWMVLAQVGLFFSGQSIMALRAPARLAGR